MTERVSRADRKLTGHGPRSLRAEEIGRNVMLRLPKSCAGWRTPSDTGESCDTVQAEETDGTAKSGSWTGGRRKPIRGDELLWACNGRRVTHAAGETPHGAGVSHCHAAEGLEPVG